MLAEARQLRKRPFERRQSDERATALMPLDPAVELELVQGLPDRGPADPETLAKIGLRRKRGSRTEPLALDQLANAGRDLDVQRQPRASVESGIERRVPHQLDRTTVRLCEYPGSGSRGQTAERLAFGSAGHCGEQRNSTPANTGAFVICSYREESLVGLFRFLARVTIGLLFVGHGTQKLFGWFGGGGPEGTGQFFEQVGLRPGRRYALAAGAAETASGALFALGAATPLAASALSGAMITAIKTVHWKKGVWTSRGGYEYNLVLLAAVFGLTENGPGNWSLDSALGRSRWGTGAALAALVAGAAGSAAVLGAAQHDAEEATEGKEGKEAEEATADRDALAAS
jgi:putative oxidoreductase